MIQILLTLFFLNPPTKTTLTWDMYSGKPNYAAIERGVVAHTETSWTLIDSTIDGRDYYSVRFSFEPTASWTTTESYYILGHEICHYRISIYWCNKLRERLSKFNGTAHDRRKEVDKLYDYCWKECNTLQDLFDHETKNSAIERIELQWEENINKVINGL